MTNLSIKIPEKLYLGCIVQEDSMPIGVMTPYGEDAASKKVMGRVDNAVTSYQRSNKAMNAVAIENRPMVGFRISRSQIRHGWNGKSTYVQVEDPRGFELAITAVNMVMLTHQNVIQNGEILSECVWGREGGENVLLPVNSDPYLQAAENTRRVNQKTSLRDVNIGDVVLMVNGDEGTYLGSMFPLLQHVSYTVTQEYRKITTGEKKKHLLMIEMEDGTFEIKAHSTFKVSEVIEPIETPMTVGEAQLLISQKCLDFNAVCTDSGYANYYHRCVGFSAGPITLEGVEEELFEESALKKVYESLGYGNTNSRSVIGRTGNRKMLVSWDNFSPNGRGSGYRYINGKSHNNETRLVGVVITDSYKTTANFTPVMGNQNSVLEDIMEDDATTQLTLVKALYQDQKTDVTFGIWL